MRIDNSTTYRVESHIKAAVADHEHSGLVVQIKYSPRGSGRFISGTYYRQASGFPDGKLIRLRVNPLNRYPLQVAFKTSEYYTRLDKMEEQAKKEHGKS